MNKDPVDGDRIDLTKSVEMPDFSTPKKWVPNEGDTMTAKYGTGTATPAPTQEEMAVLDVRKYYPYLLEGSPEFIRRQKEFLEKYAA